MINTFGTDEPAKQGFVGSEADHSASFFYRNIQVSMTTNGRRVYCNGCKIPTLNYRQTHLCRFSLDNIQVSRHICLYLSDS